MHETVDRRVAARRNEFAVDEVMLKGTVLTGLAIAIFLIAFMGILSWRTAKREAQDSDWVSHTHVTLTTLATLERHLVDVETGGRGFALTGHSPFLEPYDAGKSATTGDMEDLRRLTADNPEQQRRLDVLQSHMHARIVLVDALVTRRRQSGAIPTLIEMEQGKLEMDQVRAIIQQMEEAERQLLEVRSRMTHQSRREARFTVLLGSLLGVAFLTIAGFAINRQVSINAEARAHVTALNSDLECRVVERTAALGESESRMAGVIGSAMDAILTVDSEQRILLFNAAAEKMFRCSAADALSSPLTRFVPEHFHPEPAERVRNSSEAGVTNRSTGPRNTLRALRVDGEEFQIEASISQVFTGGKKLLTAIVRDVSETILATQARERLAAIVESSDDAIISNTVEGTITAWNRGAEKLFGYSAKEAVGKTISLIIPEDRSGEEAAIVARIRRGESVEHFETLRLRKDGASIAVSATISPLRDDRGTIIGASKVVRDITERKRTEAALQEQAQILDLGQVMTRDLDGRIVLWSHGCQQLYGYSREEATGSLSHELLSTKFPYPLAQIDEELLSKGRWEGELIHLKKDGGAVVVASIWDLYRDAQGRPVRILESNVDITERRRAETALRESEQGFQAMANGIPQLAWMAEPDGSIFWYNQRWYEYTGTTFEQMQGWAWESVHDPEVLPHVLKKWKGAIAASELFDMEFPLRGVDGTFRMFLTRVLPLRDSSGRVVRWFGTNTDISELKQVEEQLERQAEELARSREALESQTILLRSVLDSIGEGLVAADAEGNFLLWNPAAEKIVGMGASNVSPEDWSRHYGAFLPDTVTPLPLERNPLACAIRGETITNEIYLRNPDLERGVWIEASGRPLRSAGGAQRGGVIAFRDITQKRAAEKEIFKLNAELEKRVAERTAQLEEANQELESFTYSVAHDLRAPLRHIAGFSGTLLEDFSEELSGEVQRYLRRIQDGTHKMGQLVDELLTLAQVGRKTPDLQETSLNSMVLEVIEILHTETENRQVEWKVADLPSVNCDGTLLKQVFQNLISNALKYSRKRPLAVIEIGETLEAGESAIFIRDNGVGFNMKYAHKLFGVFQRLHRAEDFEGTGIGLATVHRIIKKHQGRVWAHAELDRGATFYFTLGGPQFTRLPKENMAAGAAL